MKAKDAEKVAVSVEVVPHPSPRAAFSLTAWPAGGELVLFGGEFYDGKNCRCFNDLFRYHLEKNEWRQIDSPNSPPPRCAHQSVMYKDNLYVFGGEFTTNEQFHHYKDLWCFDFATNTWEEINARGGPSARSGSRAVVWRHYLVVYGGFYQALRETKFYGDLFLFDFRERKWWKIDIPALHPQPKSRSACQVRERKRRKREKRRKEKEEVKEVCGPVPHVLERD